MAERLVTVFGGSGFVGRHLVNKLAETGCRIRVAVRDVERAKFLKPLGELGQVSIVSASISNEASVRRAVEGADVVINLVGILAESGKRTFQAIHADAAGLVALCAKDAGAKTFLHMSALGADSTSPSAYARSKAAGEEAVKAAFPTATIFRPSVIAGPEDGFYNRFAAMARLLPVMPYFCSDAPALKKGDGLPRLDFYGAGGPRFQPVSVFDVTEAMTKAVTDTAHTFEGQTFELGGPRAYTMRETMQQVCDVTRHHRWVMPVPMWVAKVQAAVLQFVPGKPLTPDQVKLLQVDNVLTGAKPGLEAFDIKAEAIEALLPSYLDRFRPLHRQIRRMGNKHT